MNDHLDPHLRLWSKLAEIPNFDINTFYKTLDALETDIDRVNFVYGQMQTHDVLPPFRKDEKNDVLAVANRQNGNRYYQRGLVLDAFNSYTFSILVAKTKEVLALGYANRSAVLLRMGLHKECLEDIARALQNGYPESLRPKLEERRRKCTAPTASRPPFEPVVVSKTANRAVEMCTNRRFGRHMIATRNVKIGEVISVEEPFAFQIIDQQLVYCSGCLKLCYNLIPCDNCTLALYCSPKCKDESLRLYHKHECTLLLSLFDLPNGNQRVTFPLRILFQQGVSTKILGLKTHRDKISKVDLFCNLALTAGVYHLVKKHTTFLATQQAETEFKDVYLKMLLICSVNQVSINEYSPAEKIAVYDKEPFGFGLYTFFSLFNHACNYNVAHHFHGTAMVLRAVATIKKGEQCFVNNGCDYLHDNPEMRQGLLLQTQYFKCSCAACEEKWPKFDLLTLQNTLIGWDCQLVICMLLNIIRTAEVNEIEQRLEYLLGLLSEIEEGRGTRESHTLVRYAVLQCYNVLGNKRRC